MIDALSRAAVRGVTPNLALNRRKNVSLFAKPHE